EAIQKALKNAAQYKIDPSKCDADYLQMRKQIDTSVALSKLCTAQGLKFADVFGPGSLASPASRAMAELLVAGAQVPAPTDADDDHGNLAAPIIESGRRRRGESDANTPLLRVVAD